MTAQRKPTRKRAVRKKTGNSNEEVVITFEDARARREDAKARLYEFIGDIIWTGVIVFAWLGVAALIYLSAGYGDFLLKKEVESVKKFNIRD